jgi:hypothetical protein
MSIEVMRQALEALEEYQAKGAPFMSCDAAVAALRAAIEQAEQYQRNNPLGGPAKVFDAMADAIRAGDDYHATLRSFGFVERTKGYDQTSLELCEECGWRAIIPGDGCLVCARQKAKPVAWFHAEKYKTHFTTDPSEDMIGKYWQPLYTAPQSINDFKPDWDTVKAYDEKFAEMLDEQQRLRVELKRTEQRLHDVATLCADVEAQAAITQGVLKAVNTAAMKLTADLTCMEIDNDDRLDRDRVMERVMRWRNEWDRAMFEYKPKVTQRKPLTDERIALIAAASGGLASDFVITVARAIEAAHGIGERT